MRRQKNINFKTEKYKYLVCLLFTLLIRSGFVIFSASICVIMYILKTGDWFDITFMVIVTTIISIFFMYPIVVFLGSSLFDITIYGNRFEIKRNITVRKNKSFNYEDIVSLKEISPIIGLYQDKAAEATVLEIILKNKKTIFIMLSAMKEENKENLVSQFEKHSGLYIDFDYRFILKFKL